MSKLKLMNIRKNYIAGSLKVEALKGVSLEFRESEFVAILGQSGCGKTTMLNVIGGLDKYDSGDLLIGGVSTKKYKDSDWDAYRNRSIGFVFQNYNLITHQTVLQNVEISMTLSGVSLSERRNRALKALEEVGLGDQIKKKPNQLSGGQMQRVAIARALVNNPDIILADEPTGALDSQTSVQVMDILREVAKTRLVIMVTHNSELAEKYANRIIKLFDGEVVSDSLPVELTPEPEAEYKKEKRPRKTSMKLTTATNLSFKNLLTKKGRTIITAFAGSIGIIGVALVLALSTGLRSYMDEMQSDALAGFPITVTAGENQVDFRTGEGGMTGSAESEFNEYPGGNILYNYDSEANVVKHENKFTDEYLEYIKKIKEELPGSVNTVAYQYGTQMNILAKGGDAVVNYRGESRQGAMGEMASAMGMNNGFWQELPDNNKFISSLYDLIGEGSRMPENKNEIVLVVDKYNRINTTFFKRLGMTDSGDQLKLTDFIGKALLKVLANDDYYKKQGDLFTEPTAADYSALYNGEGGVELKIVGILRIKESAGNEYLSTGLAYLPELTEYVLQAAESSEIAKAQKSSAKSVLTGVTFADEDEKKTAMLALGADVSATGINIYPTDFESKDKIKDYLDSYNAEKKDTEKVVYTDLAQIVTQMTGTLLSVVTYVLVGFAAISLVVSSVMIGIITYVSVIERTKEIGILRSVGARKKDISRVFNAETLIIGFTAGVLGILLTYLMTIPINAILQKLVMLNNIARLSPLHGVILILGSMALTLIAGLVPAKIASRKDPVEALRTE